MDPPDRNDPAISPVQILVADFLLLGFPVT